METYRITKENSEQIQISKDSCRNIWNRNSRTWNCGAFEHKESSHMNMITYEEHERIENSSLCEPETEDQKFYQLWCNKGSCPQVWAEELQGNSFLSTEITMALLLLVLFLQ